jgi:hypothetical protein
MRCQGVRGRLQRVTLIRGMMRRNRRWLAGKPDCPGCCRLGAIGMIPYRTGRRAPGTGLRSGPICRTGRARYADPSRRTANQQVLGTPWQVLVVITAFGRVFLFADEVSDTIADDFVSLREHQAGGEGGIDHEVIIR